MRKKTSALRQSVLLEKREMQEAEAADKAEVDRLMAEKAAEEASEGSWETIEESVYTFYRKEADELSDSDDGDDDGRYRKADRKDRLGKIYRQMLKNARISRAHADNLPRMKKFDKINLGKRSGKLYKDVEKERPYDEYYHWKKTETAEERIQRLANEVLKEEVQADLPPKEATLVLLRQTPSLAVPPVIPVKPVQLQHEDLVPEPPGMKALNPKNGKTLKSHGAHKYFNYQGRWKEGKMEGAGQMAYVDGSVYSGDWVNGRRCGSGVLTFQKGHVYAGEFEDDKFHGQGKIKMSNGVEYEGSFVQGRRSGQGKLTFPNGMVYKGTFLRGKREGFGMMTNSAGFKYVGMWEENDIRGKGAVYFPLGWRGAKDKLGKKISRRIANEAWPRQTFCEVVEYVVHKEETRLRKAREKFFELTRDIDAQILQDYVADVREYNLKVEEEKKEMQMIEERKKREERRQKMRQAKLDAQAAAEAQED